jgi:hypothetical protein
MSTYVHRSDLRLADRTPATRSVHFAWLGGGLALGFLVPYVFADLLALPRDIYLGLYAGFAIALFVAWARATGQSLDEMVRRHWVLAVTLGAVLGGVMAAIVIAEDAGPRPGGLELVWALGWRGLVYGFADGLLLSAFPILVVFAAFGWTKRRKRVTTTLAIGLAALLASIAMTAVYHLGYSDFRSEKVRKPVAGDAIWSVPTLVTLNPLGAPIAHAGLHVTAVLHNSETDVFLPPHE